MREVTVSRVLDVTPTELETRLDPPTIVEAEGSFTVEHVDDGGEGADATTTVVASGPGIQLPLRFEDRDDAIYYTQAGEQGPFSHMETWLELERTQAGDRTRVTLRSSVSLAAPIPFGDRIAAWKRKGELNRALETFEAEFA